MNLPRRYIIIIITVLLLSALIYFLGDIVGYIIGAWVLSLIAFPIKKMILHIPGIRKLKWGNGLASFLTLAVFISLLSIFFMILIPMISSQLGVLFNMDYEKIGTTLRQPLSNIEHYLIEWGIISDSTTLVNEIFNQLKLMILPDKYSLFFADIISIVANLGVAIGAVLFIGYFFIKDQGLFASAVKSVVPDHYEVSITKALSDISMLLSRYFGGLIIQSITFCIITSTLLTIMGFKNAWLMGFIGGLMNIIPYLGPWIGGAFGMLITITAHVDSDFSTVIAPMLIKVAIVFSVAQVIDNFLVSPLVFSNRVIAHPVEIFIVTLLGSKIGGLVGMVAAIPAYTVLRVLAGVFLMEFKIVQKLTAGIRKATNNPPTPSPPTGM